MQERLRAFLRYCYESKWMNTHASRFPRLGTKSFSTEFSDTNAIRVHGLVRLMRYSALLERSRSIRIHMNQNTSP